ncbi:hypothetical protein PR048_022669 [Dryococelus australis]|uniref:Uncharacterized protein n=1 Tax=Dryococelus australis TaxID=614101 RepID=A0ABQ9H1Q4_9NEOP|nr:hypothetical protein PR048_022669 [Dryococelus australis]
MWRLWHVHVNVATVARACQCGGCGTCVSMWRLWHVHVNVAAVARACQCGGCGTCMSMWRLWHVRVNVATVARVCQCGDCGTSVSMWRLWHVHVNVAAVACACQCGDCGTCVSMWRLWHERVNVAAVARTRQHSLRRVFSIQKTSTWPMNATYKHRSQDEFKVNVWEGILDIHLIGPYFLPHRLNQINDHIFLCEVLPELLNDEPIHVRFNMWFQHDAAPAYCDFRVQKHLNDEYSER